MRPGVHLALGFRVQGLGFRVWSFGVWGSGFRVWGLGFKFLRGYQKVLAKASFPFGLLRQDLRVPGLPQRNSYL